MEKDRQVNKTYEYSETIGKSVKIILSNNFHFTGIVLEVTEKTMIILDKFKQRTTLNKEDIVILTEVNQNGSN